MKYIYYFLLQFLFDVDKLEKDPCYLDHEFNYWEPLGVSYQKRFCKVCNLREDRQA